MIKLSQREYTQGEWESDPALGDKITKPGDFYVDKYGRFYFEKDRANWLHKIRPNLYTSPEKEYAEHPGAFDDVFVKEVLKAGSRSKPNLGYLAKYRPDLIMPYLNIYVLLAISRCRAVPPAPPVPVISWAPVIAR